MKNAKKQRNEKRKLKEVLFPCYYKRKFKHYKIALECMNKEMNKRCKQLYVYKCEFCHYWHLTSSPPREQKAG
jgi:hypothetical protein